MDDERAGGVAKDRGGGENGVMTVKKQLHKLVDELPEEDPIEAMQYRL